MTSKRDAYKALMEQIAKVASQEEPLDAEKIVLLAEAYAWLERPDQPHGGLDL